MIKSKAEKLKILRNLEREDDIHSLLYEILPELGFGDVYITHERGNKSENGKDLICSKEDEVEDRKDWFAFVVKKGVVAGRSAVIQDIIAQTKDCFEYEYKDVIKGLRIRINKVKIVSNKHFSAEAKVKIESNNHFDKANISFWDEDKLIQLIDKHFPQYWVKGSKPYKKYVERFTDRIQTETISKSIGISDKKIQKILDCAIEPKILERVENKDGTFNWKSKSTHSIVNLANNSIIIGEPGAGKSTLFKILSKEIIEQNSLRNDAELYPIILTFQELKNTNFNLEKSIQEYFKNEWNSDLAIDGEIILKTKSCVIFIDAMDELPQIEQKEAALKTINEFHSKYPDIKIICSSRPSEYLFYNCADLGFKYLEINPIDRKQVEGFLNAYFADNLIKSKRLLKSLRDTGILEKLPKTPLTIALITILFDEKDVEIPATITDLYRQFVDLLLGKYTPESTFDIIEVGIKHRLLCHIAKLLHSSKQQSISILELKQILLDYSKERGQTFDIESLLDDLISNTGILFKNAKGEIQFKHLSFQEYLTAYEMFHHRQNESELFIKQFNTLWWQNVAIFYAGMSKDAPKLLQEILKESEPKNFGEFILNTGGIGKLLQALYNTPIEYRMEGVKRGTENIVAAIKYLINTDDSHYDIWKNFSKYGLMQVIGVMFPFSYWSITLVEPLKQQFERMLKDIDQQRSEEDQFYFEYKLFLICQILASGNFLSFKELRQLIEKSKSNDLSLFAIIHTHVTRLESHISNIEKDDIDFKKLEKKVRRKQMNLGDFADKVNTPLKRQLK